MVATTETSSTSEKNATTAEPAAELAAEPAAELAAEPAAEQATGPATGKRSCTAAVLGATGLIGGHLAELLVSDSHFSKVRLIGRRVPDNVPHGAEVVVIDFDDPASFSAAIGGSEAVFCAVGTTRKKVKGDMDAYRKVDLDIPVNAARHCLKNGCRHFSLVSSVGASAHSGNFYLRFKGKAEKAVTGIGLPSVALFRPSMLMGKRNEFRLAEEIARIFASPLSFLFPSKYRPIRGFDVARAMIAAAKLEEPGFRVFHFNEMMALIGK